MGLKANKKYMSYLIHALASRFELSKGGQIHYLLGMHITHDREKRTISFSQSAYINRILTRYRFDEVRTVTTPMDPNVALSKEQCAISERQKEEMKDKPYREALGALMYASVGTRPDITYAVSTLAKFSQNPGPTHWTALKRVFAYLRGTQHYTLTLGGDSSEVLTGYCDSDGMSRPDRHPIAAYVFTIGGAISWSSKRQDIVCLSTTEAEYIALTHAAKEAIWLYHLLDEVFPERFKLPITVYSDNQGAIALSKDDRFHTRTKHIDIRFHFVRQYVEDGTLNITYLPTDRMLADALTKALPGPQLRKLAGAIGIQTYKTQANCAFLVSMPSRPTQRYHQPSLSSRSDAANPPSYNSYSRRRPRQRYHPFVAQPTLPEQLPIPTRGPIRPTAATPRQTQAWYPIPISPAKTMSTIAFMGLAILTITAIICLHAYVLTKFMLLMNQIVKGSQASTYNNGWGSYDNNNNNAGGWGNTGN
ncbi:hypothetical protein EW026_g6901 [Hermanssonia centrifuga]|uniref:Reverse transcriptase Ty1/copia-type domain-containing protein n=1 Tax=Hermanssonia centrifuga TaxID=98765 RepID=A0A4V3X9K8_9APHY|nr:hypothetical protein EW026_g6901 [Hermanssonia centrifuga]